MTAKTKDKFELEVSSRALDYNLPQKMGRRMWGPMFAMSMMAWPVAIILAGVRAAEVAGPNTDQILVARLGQLVPAVMFIGFLSVFAAISFAIARILGVFRRGGGEIQEATRRQVRTLLMPRSAKAFMALMMMGMMIIAVAVVLHFVAAAAVSEWTSATLEQWSIVLEGARRIGVALYLTAITLGLGTIITVLRFQSQRISELGSEAAQI
jgi:multisubunit Na+/H+ antiporter MnhC subunit